MKIHTTHPNWKKPPVPSTRDIRIVGWGLFASRVSTKPTTARRLCAKSSPVCHRWPVADGFGCWFLWNGSRSASLIKTGFKYFKKRLDTKIRYNLGSWWATQHTAIKPSLVLLVEALWGCWAPLDILEGTLRACRVMGRRVASRGLKMADTFVARSWKLETCIWSTLSSY